MQLSFFFDPIGPWRWETARWFIESRSHRPAHPLDHLVALARLPGFFERKLGREARPQLSGAL